MNFARIAGPIGPPDTKKAEPRDQGVLPFARLRSSGRTRTYIPKSRDNSHPLKKHPANRQRPAQ
jgi:hypothetical protein